LPRVTSIEGTPVELLDELYVRMDVVRVIASKMANWAGSCGLVSHGPAPSNADVVDARRHEREIDALRTLLLQRLPA
jgi:hypothetical protein